MNRIFFLLILILDLEMLNLSAQNIKQGLWLQESYIKNLYYGSKERDINFLKPISYITINDNILYTSTWLDDSKKIANIKDLNIGSTYKKVSLGLSYGNGKLDPHFVNESEWYIKYVKDTFYLKYVYKEKEVETKYCLFELPKKIFTTKYTSPDILILNADFRGKYSVYNIKLFSGLKYIERINIPFLSDINSNYIQSIIIKDVGITVKKGSEYLKLSNFSYKGLVFVGIADYPKRKGVEVAIIPIEKNRYKNYLILAITRIDDKVFINMELPIYYLIHSPQNKFIP